MKTEPPHPGESYHRLTEAQAEQQALITALRSPDCYPHRPAGVEVMETHISTILLAGDHVYKLKKPLKLDFLDFSTPERRAHYCREELRLNRPRAPELYLECVAIRGDRAHPRIGGTGPVLEHAVHMRRFPEHCRLDHVLEAGGLDPAAMEILGEELARMHGNAPVAPGDDHRAGPAAQTAPIADNLRELQQLLGNHGELPALIGWCTGELRSHRALMRKRAAGGAVRECHGDLHLANIIRLEGRFIPFDGIEFSESLRWIDVLNDLAFLLMDLHARGQSALAARLLSAYLDETGDHGGVPLLRLFQCYRALVRAKINAIRLRQLPDSSRERDETRAWLDRYLRLAARCMHPAAPTLWVTAGLSGSGKSTVALDVVEREGAVRLRSDVERKRLFGLDRRARTGAAPAEGIYSAEAGERTYAHLQRTAGLLLEAGWSVIVDAANLRRRERDLFRQVAAGTGVPCRILWCEAEVPTLRERIRQRQAEGRDPSEADASVLERQLGWHEPPADDEIDIQRISTEGGREETGPFRP